MKSVLKLMLVLVLFISGCNFSYAQVDGDILTMPENVPSNGPIHNSGSELAIPAAGTELSKCYKAPCDGHVNEAGCSDDYYSSNGCCCSCHTPTPDENGNCFVPIGHVPQCPPGLGTYNNGDCKCSDGSQVKFCGTAN